MATAQPDHIALTSGHLIVLTGEMRRTREDWMAELSAADSCHGTP